MFAQAGEAGGGQGGEVVPEALAGGDPVGQVLLELVHADLDLLGQLGEACDEGLGSLGQLLPEGDVGFLGLLDCLVEGLGGPADLPGQIDGHLAGAAEGRCQHLPGVAALDDVLVEASEVEAGHLEPQAGDGVLHLLDVFRPPVLLVGEFPHGDEGVELLSGGRSAGKAQGSDPAAGEVAAPGEGDEGVGVLGGCGGSGDLLVSQRSGDLDDVVAVGGGLGGVLQALGIDESERDDLGHEGGEAGADVHDRPHRQAQAVEEGWQKLETGGDRGAGGQNHRGHRLADFLPEGDQVLHDRQQLLEDRDEAFPDGDPGLLDLGLEAAHGVGGGVLGAVEVADGLAGLLGGDLDRGFGLLEPGEIVDSGLLGVLQGSLLNLCLGDGEAVGLEGFPLAVDGRLQRSQDGLGPSAGVGE